MEILMALGGGVGLLAIVYFLYNKFTKAAIVNSQAEYKQKDNVLDFKQKELIVKSEEIKKEINQLDDINKKLSPSEIENKWNKKEE